METTPTATATDTGVLDYHFLPLGFGSTYGSIFQVFRDRWSALTGIAVVMYAVGWICCLLLNLVWGNDIRLVGFASVYGDTCAFMWSIYGYALYGYAFDELELGFSDLAFYVMEVALYYVLASVAHGASVWVTMQWYAQQSQPPVDAFESALCKCGSLVGATAVIALFVILPALLPAVMLWLFAGMCSESTVVEISIVLLVLWVVWSLCISIVTSMVYAVIMAEGRGPWASIKRSSSLGQGQWGSIVGISVVWVLSKAVLIILIAYCSILGDPIVTNMLGTSIGILLLAIAPVFECVIYLNLRVQKEELGSVTLGGEIVSEHDSYSTMVPSVAKESAPVVLAELPSLA